MQYYPLNGAPQLLLYKRTRLRIKLLSVKLKKILISDYKQAEKSYERKKGLKPDLRNPKTYSEKLLYLKLHYRNPLQTLCADKYYVAEYVRACGYGYILKKNYAVYLKQPKGESVMTVTSNSLKFNKATAVELNYAPYIRVLLNAKTRQIAIQPCSEKDPNAIKFSNEESKQTYAISIKVPAIQVEFRRMLPFEDDNGGKLSYTLNGTLYPDEQVVIYDGKEKVIHSKS